MKFWPTIYPKLFSIHMHQLLIYHKYRNYTYQSVQNPHFIHYFATESQSLSCHQRNRKLYVLSYRVPVCRGKATHCSHRSFDYFCSLPLPCFFVACYFSSVCFFWFSKNLACPVPPILLVIFQKPHRFTVCALFINIPSFIPTNQLFL